MSPSGSIAMVVIDTKNNTNTILMVNRLFLRRNSWEENTV
jgi:hypothetical protein